VRTLPLGFTLAQMRADIPGRAVNKDQCKNNSWKNLRRANNTTLKNHGDCVSYTNNGK